MDTITCLVKSFTCIIESDINNLPEDRTLYRLLQAFCSKMTIALLELSTKPSVMFKQKSLSKFDAVPTDKRIDVIYDSEYENRFD